MIGGDYCGVQALTPDHYGFLIADVSGHGIPAALYTMFLSSLWAAHQELLLKPVEFARMVGNRLEQLIEENEPFAAAICGVLDLKQGEVRLVGAGNPNPLIRRADGRWEEPRACGLPLGMMGDADYDELVLPLHAGDSLLFFTDGAVEIAFAVISASSCSSVMCRRFIRCLHSQALWSRERLWASARCIRNKLPP